MDNKIKEERYRLFHKHMLGSNWYKMCFKSNYPDLCRIMETTYLKKPKPGNKLLYRNPLRKKEFREHLMLTIKNGLPVRN